MPLAAGISHYILVIFYVFIKSSELLGLHHTEDHKEGDTQQEWVDTPQYQVLRLKWKAWQMRKDHGYVKTNYETNSVMFLMKFCSIGRAVSQWVGSTGHMHSTVDCYFKVKWCRAQLVLGWVTARVLDCKACPPHWMGRQVGQVVSLLGPWHYGSHSELLTTVIRQVSWVNGPYLTTGVFSRHSGSLPQLNHDKILSN